MAATRGLATAIDAGPSPARNKHRPPDTPIDPVGQIKAGARATPGRRSR
ncbi:hypothetical protein RSPO_c01792 [Ralstonia solanacearum Po82]|uniref:Uncharacterized protein n=1 Tax=Ralstonia solanacearum (strain Po82) TaxID=1031711 RepID=F6G0W2_RALS8|nr:hypothetical protein RSPO_c01792 [Ralstonia solanacearum Po82]